VTRPVTTGARILAGHSPDPDTIPDSHLRNPDIRHTAKAPRGGPLRAGQRRRQQDPGCAPQQRLRTGAADRRCRDSRPWV